MGALEGKVALITGATGALGHAVTMAFLDAGASVAGAARKIQDSDFPYPRFAGFAANVAAEADAAKLVEQTVAKFGRVNALVHLVGSWAPGDVDDTSIETFDAMLNVNLKTSFLMIRAALKPMKQQGGGRIIAIGSKAAVEPMPGSAMYSASKAALVSLIRSVAAGERDRGITANIVLPSTIDTAENRKAMPNADFAKWVDPAQIAALLVHLASDAASSITGAVIPIFGKEG